MSESLRMNIPTFFTYVRIVLIPAIVVAYYLPTKYGHLIAAIIFVIASITDWLDGFLARRLKQTTKLGAFLDPVADKLVVAAALVLIVGEFGAVYITIPAVIIVGREIAVSALREWMAEMGRRTSVAVNRVGKLKTAVQMVALILLLLYHPDFRPWIVVSGIILLYSAAILTLWSMIMYAKAAWSDLTSLAKKQ
jgi:CDP-diacylglycerol--glycerol-3-phosphate 3-phosphatidyltransferase